MQEMTPRQIVEELDLYIIGQDEGKRAVAVAIRNRWRRRKLDPDMACEVYPKNIIMIGPTGVGKTEIARRLATLTGAPFIKVEASKFTEVGYHGRDVESMVRDLLDNAISIVHAEQARTVEAKAMDEAVDRIVDHLLPTPEITTPGASDGSVVTAGTTAGMVRLQESDEALQRARERLREQVLEGKLDEREIEITLTSKPQAQVMFANMGLDQMDPQMADVFERMIPEQTKRRKVTVADAKRIFADMETEKLIDNDAITNQAIERMEESGIIFLDEIDKIATPGGGDKGGGGGGTSGGGPDVSRQGVQRDLLPIVEGSAITTRYGVVHTDHILFIAAGAFHSAAVSDLMPELQGRFPIRVELSPLTKDDFIRILTEPGNALTKQQQALLGVEGLSVTFAEDSIDAMAELAACANANLENIGARRLSTIIEKVFEQINFDAPDMATRGETSVTINADFVQEQVAAIVADEDLSKFVL